MQLGMAPPLVVRSYPYRRGWDYLAEAIERFPDHLAVECVHQPARLYGLGREEGKHGRWSYRDLDNGISRLAGAFERLDLLTNSLIFVLLGNSLEHVLTTWTSYRLGCVHVSIHPNSLSNAAEARHLLDTVRTHRPSCRAAVIVQNAEAARRVDEIFPALECVKIVVDDEPTCAQPPAWASFSTLMQEDLANVQPARIFPVTPEISIFFSSGTTSLPKPCEFEVPVWLSSLASGSTFGDFAPGDRVMSLVPCSHSFGYMAQMFALTRGSTLVYPSYLTFDPRTTMDILGSETHQYLIIVSALIHAFVTADLHSQKLRPIDTVIFSGMALTSAAAIEFHASVRPSAIENVFGMTEGGFVSTGRVEGTRIQEISHESFVAAGQPMKDTQVKLCAPGSNEEIGPGVAGEVHVSSPATVRGYLGVSSDAFYVDSDGCAWYRTGDQAILNPKDGLLYPVGRYKDLIIRGGKNISPTAIEAVLNQDEAFHQLTPQAVALPDLVVGEVPAIVLNADIPPSEAQRIRQRILSEMGSIYLPDLVVSIQALGLEQYPRTSSGKIQKVKLAQLVRKYHEEELTKADGLLSTTIATPSTLVPGDVRSTMLHLWAAVLGITQDQLDLTAKLSERVDSITLMRAHSRATKRTGKTVPFAVWLAANSIEDQIAVLEAADSSPGSNSTPSSVNTSTVRSGPPELEDMVHLLGDASRLPATKALVEQNLTGCGLTWQDVEDVFPATDFQHIMRQAHLIENWEFWVCVHTEGYTSAQLRHALETTLTVHPMLRSFAVLDPTPEAPETLLVTVRHSPAILDQCIVDYGEVDTVADVERLTINFPAEHRVGTPGPLFRGLIVFVKQISSAVLVADFCHSIMDATYYELFEDDLDLALGGLPLNQPVPYKAWTESYYLLQDSKAGQPALEYHRSQVKSLVEEPVALWPTPTASLLLASDQREQGQYQLEFSLPTLIALRDHHPTVTTAVTLKAALALLTTFHTKHPQALVCNIEAARGGFPFLPSSLPRGGQLDGARVAGPTLTGVIEKLRFNPEETVLQLLYRLQAQQLLITQHANAPWRALLSEMPRLRQLYPEVANHLVFNWTGTTTFKADEKKRMHERLSRQRLFFLSTTGLMIDAGASGKDGIDFCVWLTGAVANGSSPWVREIARGLQTITTWLVEPENWERPVGSFVECLRLTQ
ncbi:acetyl-CoA synthetase-like protein [Aspergillus uvarum CBS 121591]|uniref:Acetyl-CoA synthetase-like protein n=1 Tax=Aspergillus uvarum CBS 121591 TaxID=1448315 RepID=A0A319DB39_9EURO|nr:acetyl-CoA synthetase-like protein [Aspergillus uvarum CBS 121591]PYH85268.1 acetyl-CoA synthetase-like protein [Aspergillus uvarum CBS 121591]